MIRHAVRALCAASLIVTPLALSTPAHAVTCTVNGIPRTATNLTGTAGSDYIRCTSIPSAHSVDGLGGSDYIVVTGTVAQGAAVRGGAGSDYLQVNVNNGTVSGGEGIDYCRVSSGNPPQSDCESR
ncbi:hypothetical protein GPZ77_26855 [Streptomyces sp. QHH-9511]|uniref:hypothetical protein n=1 Tax=Streptomyces sp. QHH-9511 TaxID=2684468 RepID=UPI0013193958|nr:hypothetical protein [Streptomyces sp. QHH-9511]QGZ51515.1 hypothetical protein GPZ77_26855 [Streptomyces sp. QHH-9511]